MAVRESTGVVILSGKVCLFGLLRTVVLKLLMSRGPYLGLRLLGLPASDTDAATHFEHIKVGVEVENELLGVRLPLRRHRLFCSASIQLPEVAWPCRRSHSEERQLCNHFHLVPATSRRLQCEEVLMVGDLVQPVLESPSEGTIPRQIGLITAAGLQHRECADIRSADEETRRAG